MVLGYHTITFGFQKKAQREQIREFGYETTGFDDLQMGSGYHRERSRLSTFLSENYSPNFDHLNNTSGYKYNSKFEPQHLIPYPPAFVLQNEARNSATWTNNSTNNGIADQILEPFYYFWEYSYVCSILISAQKACACAPWHFVLAKPFCVVVVQIFFTQRLSAHSLVQTNIWGFCCGFSLAAPTLHCAHA